MDKRCTFNVYGEPLGCVDDWIYDGENCPCLEGAPVVALGGSGSGSAAFGCGGDGFG
jgi:hypothetical protein